MHDLSLSKSFEFLRLSENSDINTVKKRYHQLAQKYHPDAVVSKNDTEQSQAHENFKSITTAYQNILNYLSGNAQVTEDTIDDTDLKDKLYANGVQHFKSGDVNTALEFFLKAQKIDQHNPQFVRAIIRCLITKPRRLLEAKEHGMTLLKSDPFNPENQYLMGRIYQTAGFPEPAKSFYDKAIKMGYDVNIVNRSLQEIKLTNKKKGLFGKLLNRN